MLEIPAQIWQRTKTSDVWPSLFRHGYTDSRKIQALAVFTNVFLHLHPVKVRRHALAIPYTWCMGGLSFFLFLVLTLTGTLLMFYYRPTTEWAYSDIKDLETVVIFGQLLRNMHRWAAHGMVITVFLHMIRVFYTGSYKPPLEFNWVIGTLLFFFTILLSYTGYLLPWDQLSFWTVTVGYDIARATPFIGDEFSFALLGGSRPGLNALLRLYLLNLQELLLHMDKGLAGVVVPTLWLVFMAFIPYIDRSREGVGIYFTTPKGRTITIFAAVYATVLTFTLIVLDKVLKDIGYIEFASDHFPGGKQLFPNYLIPIATMLGLSFLLVVIVKRLYGAGTREWMIAIFTGLVSAYLVLTIVATSMPGTGLNLFLPWDVPSSNLCFELAPLISVITSLPRRWGYSAAF